MKNYPSSKLLTQMRKEAEPIDLEFISKLKKAAKKAKKKKPSKPVYPVDKELMKKLME